MAHTSLHLRPDVASRPSTTASVLSQALDVWPVQKASRAKVEMDSRIVDDKIEVRNVVAVQPGWLLPRFGAGWAKEEYYFNYEPVIALGHHGDQWQTSRHTEQRALEGPNVHPITVERGADAFPGRCGQ